MSRAFFRNEFFRNHVIQWLFSFSFLGNIALWGVCAWYFHDKNQVVVMRANAYLGVDPFSMGPWYDPYRIPLFASLFLLLALAVAWHFFGRRDRIMAHLCVFCAGMIQVFSAIALSTVILVNR